MIINGQTPLPRRRVLRARIGLPILIINCKLDLRGIRKSPFFVDACYDPLILTIGPFHLTTLQRFKSWIVLKFNEVGLWGYTVIEPADCPVMSMLQESAVVDVLAGRQVPAPRLSVCHRR